MFRYVTIQNHVAFRSSDGLDFRIVVSQNYQRNKERSPMLWGCKRRSLRSKAAKDIVRKQTYSTNSGMVYADARLGRSIAYSSWRHAFLNWKLRNYLLCRTKIAIKAEKMLGCLGASLFLFSAIRMQKARGFLFALKI